MDLIQDLARQIAARGISNAFGISGSGATLALLDELEKLGVESIRTHFEGTAALMAGTVGRLSGAAGIAFGIKGPGVANMVPGLAACRFDGYPLVAIAEAYPPGTAAGRAHKRMNHEALTSEVTKGARFLSRGGPDFDALAGWAESEVPGPVLLQLAGDSLDPAAAIPDTPDRRLPDAAVLTLLEAVNRPVVIVGTLAIRAGLERKLQQLRIPIFSTAAAKGVVDETTPYAAGVYTGVGSELAPEVAVLAEADLIVGVGLRPNEVLSVKPFDCPAVNVDPAKIPGAEDFAFEAETGIFSDAILALLEDRAWGEDLVRDTRFRLFEATRDGFLPATVFRAIASLCESTARMILDTGYFCTIGEHVWTASRSDLCLLSGQGRYMGTVVPMALGAAIHDPETPVIAVAGDGGIGMYAGEIRIAVERRLPILFVLMSDGRYGSIASRAVADCLSMKAITIRDPSWRAIMDGYGMRTWRADDVDGVRDALAAWDPHDGPAYLEVDFDPDQYESMCRGIR